MIQKILDLYLPNLKYLLQATPSLVLHHLTGNFFQQPLSILFITPMFKCWINSKCCLHFCLSCLNPCPILITVKNAPIYISTPNILTNLIHLNLHLTFCMRYLIHSSNLICPKQNFACLHPPDLLLKKKKKKITLHAFSLVKISNLVLFLSTTFLIAHF